MVRCALRWVSGDWRDIPVRLVSPINIRPTLGRRRRLRYFHQRRPKRVRSRRLGLLGACASRQGERRRRAGAGRSRGGQLRASARRRQRFRYCRGGGVCGDCVCTAGDDNKCWPPDLSQPIGAVKLKALWGPAALHGLEGEQTIGVATVDGSLYLTHTSHTAPARLLEAMQSVLVEAGST
jgi:hypothetical protein